MGSMLCGSTGCNPRQKRFFTNIDFTKNAHPFKLFRVTGKLDALHMPVHPVPVMYGNRQSSDNQPIQQKAF